MNGYPKAPCLIAWGFFCTKKPEKLPQATAKPANGTSAMVQPNLPMNGPAQPAAPANQTVQPAKKETPEEHRAKRQAQWEAAYDKRRDAPFFAEALGIRTAPEDFTLRGILRAFLSRIS